MQPDGSQQPPPRSGARGKIIQLILVICVLIGGGVITKKLLGARESAKSMAPPNRGALVEITQPTVKPQRAVVTAQGTVTPAQQVTLQPQVQGAITELSPQLVPGGVLRAGEALLKIEDADYRLAVEQQQANLAQAEFNLEVEEGRRVVAEREWRLLKKRGGAATEGTGALARREPHIRAAKASLKGARSALRRARLDVNRTRIEAPFNAIVESESVEIGQVARLGTAVATLVGTDAFWVEIAVPQSELGWITLPDAQGEGGSPATVLYDSEGSTHRRPGRVVRRLGRLDPIGRMARLLVEVRDPLNLAGDPQRHTEPPALLLGAYVTVEIEGKPLGEILEVPRLALRSNDTLWTVEGGALAIKPVDVIRRRADTVLIRGDVKATDQIVLSRLAAPVPGMKLRIAGDPAAPAKAHAGQPGEAPADQEKPL